VPAAGAVVAVAAVCCGLLFVTGCGSDTTERKRPSPAGTDVRQPGPSDTGVPRGWAPKRILDGNLVVTKAGSTVQDVLLRNGDLVVQASDVTIRRVKLQGGRIHNVQGATCHNGMVVEDSTIQPAPGKTYSRDSEAVLGEGGYTAHRVKIWRRSEGFRVGGRSAGCGPVRIEGSYARISIAPGCPGDPHSDGIQGYDGAALTVRNVTVDFREAACGTAPFFVPDGAGNTSVSISGMLVMGGGYTFRLGVPGTVKGLKIVDGSWSYAPVDVNCSAVVTWDAEIVTITHDYQVARAVRAQPCG
jgi:hypothetical protein